jgi:hypothetical protein
MGDAGIEAEADQGGDGTTYYIAPNGSDDAPGTLLHPFATVLHARDVVRTINTDMHNDVTVFLRAGEYELREPFVLEERDSGTNGHKVVYSAYGYGTPQVETPTLSGGRHITGWTLADATKHLFKVEGIDIASRQLYVNGKRVPRASTTHPPTLARTATGYTSNDAAVRTWTNPSDIELVYSGAVASGSDWTQLRCGVQSLQSNGGTTAITMKEPCWTNGTQRMRHIDLPSSIENAFELLDTGQWYWNRSTRTLYYAAASDTDMSQVEVIAPVLEQLIDARGTAAPLHDVEFEGLRFAYATWLAPSGNDGFIEIQANRIAIGSDAHEFTSPANVTFAHVKSVVLERNVFEHLGAQGVAFDHGSQNVQIVGNVFTDISGTGLRIGDVDTPKATADEQDRDVTVANNYVHDLPAEYMGGVAIMGGYVASMSVQHNELARLPYTGVSLGWGWGTASYARDNDVSFNHIHDLMQVLRDGGGVYTLSAQGDALSRSRVHDNYIHDQKSEFGALYHDEGSAYFDTFNNVVSHVPRWLHIWIDTIHDIEVHDNFTDTTTLTNNGTNISLHDNYTGGLPWPSAASAIISNAGLEAGFRDLLQ